MSFKSLLPGRCWCLRPSLHLPGAARSAQEGRPPPPAISTRPRACRPHHRVHGIRRSFSTSTLNSMVRRLSSIRPRTLQHTRPPASTVRTHTQRADHQPVHCRVLFVSSPHPFAPSSSDMLGEKALDTPPDFKPPTTMGPRKWFSYMANVASLAPAPKVCITCCLDRNAQPCLLSLLCCAHHHSTHPTCPSHTCAYPPSALTHKQGGMKFGEVPEGVKVLGGTYALDGADITFSHMDEVPGATPEIEEVLASVGA